MRSLFTTLLLALGVVGVAGNTCAIEDSVKTDCAGGMQTVNAENCLARGCCWQQSYTNHGVPWCYYTGGDSVAGYDLKSMATTQTGFSGRLSLRSTNGVKAYGPDITDLALNVVFHTEDVVQVKITDAKNARWEVPESILPRPQPSLKLGAMNYNVTYTEAPFSLTVTRASDSQQIFHLDSEMIFKDQYLEMNIPIDAEAKTFGLGESTRTNHALKANNIYTLWAADIAAQDFNKNLYGSYPMYLQLVKGQAHGMMLLNSNGMDITLKSDRLKYQVIGGVLDLYIFNGPTPEQVIQQYTHVVGRPTMMPYWSLGFHNCRWGYSNLQEVKEVVANYSSAGIPLETQWVDIDHMEEYRDFTLSSKNFPQADMTRFVDDLHAKGQKFVPIVDPGIMPYAGYEAYEEGLKQGVFIKDITGGFYLGQVWPGPTNFPDFFHPSAQSYWTNQIKSFHDKIAIDGVWIDMNEISNFCNAYGTAQYCENTDPTNCPDGCCLVCKQVDPTNKLDYPPYNINNAWQKLGIKTISMASTQYGSLDYYNTHNLYGLTEQIATNQALQTVRGKRPFVLSRSSFLSTGTHSAKWTGDNAATWDDLKSSIVSIMDFNIFGVPMIGADICGFNGDTTEELCARWIEVGAFYPFSRDHNTIGAVPQELYRWNSVSEAGKKALTMRYQMLPYLYTLFYQAHSTGSTVVRALWANFPSDTTAASIDRQFMWGNAVLFSPVLDAGVTEVNAYFPSGLWYKFSDLQIAVDNSDGNGKFVTLPTPLTETNVHIHGGNVLALQDAAMTTSAARQTPFTLVAALCPGGRAKGQLFVDDGEQISIDRYLVVDYEAITNDSLGGLLAGRVAKNTLSSDETSSVAKLGQITIAGKALSAPRKVTFNGQVVKSDKVHFANNVLTVTLGDANMSDNFVLTWH